MSMMSKIGAGLHRGRASSRDFLTEHAYGAPGFAPAGGHPISGVGGAAARSGLTVGHRGMQVGRRSRALIKAHPYRTSAIGATVGIASGGAMWARHRDNQMFQNASYGGPADGYGPYGY